MRDDRVSRVGPEDDDVRRLDARDERERHAGPRARGRVQPHDDDPSDASQGAEDADGKKEEREGGVAEVVDARHAQRRERDATQVGGDDATRAVRRDEEVDDDRRDGRQTEKEGLRASEPPGVRHARAGNGHEVREVGEEYRGYRRSPEEVGEGNDRRDEKDRVLDERRRRASADREVFCVPLFAHLVVSSSRRLVVSSSRRVYISREIVGRVTVFANAKRASWVYIPMSRNTCGLASLRAWATAFLARSATCWCAITCGCYSNSTRRRERREKTSSISYGDRC